MYNKKKGNLCHLWSEYTVSIFDFIDGRTTSKINPWRRRVILLVIAIMTTLYILMLYYKSLLVYPRLSRASSLPDVTQNLNDYLQYIVDLYYISKYDKNAYAEYYRQYTVIDHFLNRQPEPEIKARIAKLIGVFTLIWFFNFVIHYSAIWLEFYWEYPFVFIPFHISVFAKILTTLFLSAHSIRVECRLQMIGDFVEDFDNMSEGWQRVKVLNEFRRGTTAKTVRSSEIQDIRPGPKHLQYSNHKNITRLSKFYLILTEQCEFVNNVFGVRILLLSLNLTIDMVRFINSLYRYISGKQFSSSSQANYPLASASASRALICMAMLFSLVHHCERAYRQTDRITRLCDRVLITSTVEGEERASVSELRELVVSRPVSFTVAQFFRLEYPALTAVAATVVSYSIILFQSV